MYQQVTEFPHLMVDKNTNMAWPTVIDNAHDDSGFMLTFRSFEPDPVVSFALRGNLPQIAKHIVEVIFQNRVLTIELIKYLSTDPAMLKELLYEPNQN
jgi:hypothetical protein